MCVFVCFFFQAEDGIRDLVRSRGLGDVYKRQAKNGSSTWRTPEWPRTVPSGMFVYSTSSDNRESAVSKSIAANASRNALSLIHI